MNSDTGNLADLAKMEKSIKELIGEEASQEQLQSRLEVEAKAQGFDVVFRIGDEVEFHGQTLILTYVNVGHRRLTFMPKKAIEQGFRT